MTAPRSIDPAQPPAFERQLAGVAAIVRSFTVAVDGRGRPGHGSGVVWRHDGLIVTSAHVARDPRPVITLCDERRVEAHVVARDAALDLALLRVDERGLLIAPPGDPWALRQGTILLAHDGQSIEPKALSLGVVRSVTCDVSGDPQWIATDMARPSHTTGGALVDTFARVVGINSALVSGLGAAVPVNVVQRFIKQAEGRGLIRSREAWAA